MGGGVVLTYQKFNLIYTPLIILFSPCNFNLRLPTLYLTEMLWQSLKWVAINFTVAQIMALHILWHNVRTCILYI